MLNIKNPVLLQAVIARAVVKVATSFSLSKGMKKRWTIALGKATKYIETDYKFLKYDEENETLLFWSDSSDVIYTDCLHCNCPAKQRGVPCHHACLARIVESYREAERVGKFRVEVFTSNFKGFDQTEETYFYFYDEAEKFAKEHLKTSCAVWSKIFNAEGVHLETFEMEREQIFGEEIPYLKYGTGQKTTKLGNIRF